MWYVVTYSLILVLSLLGARGCNSYFNNKTILASGHQTISMAQGLSGHTEYTRYEDGSQEVKTYPGWGHRLFDSQLDQDLDGDGQVDRIRKSSGEIRANSLATLLIRKYDYSNNQDIFQKADSKLKKLMEQHFRSAVR